MSKCMNKRQLIEELSERAFTTKKQTNAIIEALTEIVSREAVNGFTIPGLCKFEVVERKARKGRNPRTGEPLDIPAGKILKSRPLGKIKHAATAWLTDNDQSATLTESSAEPTVHSFFIQCPHCTRKLEADSSMVGMVAECPYCEQSMTVPVPGIMSKPKPASTDAYVYFYCPSCQQAIESPSEEIGRNMHCPTCKAMVLVPSESGLSPEMEELSRKEMLGNTIRINIPY